MTNLCHPLNTLNADLAERFRCRARLADRRLGPHIAAERRHDVDAILGYVRAIRLLRTAMETER